MKYFDPTSSLHIVQNHCENLNKILTLALEEEKNKKYICGSTLHKIDDSIEIFYRRATKLVENLCEKYL